MNRILVLIFSIVVLSIQGCDTIDDPIKDTNGTTPPPEETVRNFLVEDYTGVKCKNCPDAAKKLSELEVAFGDRIVGIAVHGGFFSPDNNPDYPVVLHNSQSLQWVNFFNIQGWPIGMVNRFDHPGDHLKSPGTWPTLVNDHIDDEPAAKIDVTASIDTTTGDVTIDSELSFLLNYSGSIKYVVCITEDKIIGPQLMPTNQIKQDYEHNHVLRACVNTAFGESVATDPIVGDELTLSHKYTLDPSWVPANCHVVTFLFDASTYEVLQAEKASF